MNNQERPLTEEEQVRAIAELDKLQTKTMQIAGYFGIPSATIGSLSSIITTIVDTQTHIENRDLVKAIEFGGI